MRERLGRRELGRRSEPDACATHTSRLPRWRPRRNRRPRSPRAVDRPSAVVALPRRPTSFVGRERKSSRAVAGALHEGPLLTSDTGVEVSARHGSRSRPWRAGQGPLPLTAAWLCELAPLDDGAAVGHAVAAALRLQQQQGLDIEATVIEYLATRVSCCWSWTTASTYWMRPLGCSDQIVTALPNGCRCWPPAARPLGIEGERILPVPPLTVEDATALFADRRQGRPPGLRSRSGAGAARSLRSADSSTACRLAIELAAARMRVMSSLDVARRLDGADVCCAAARAVRFPGSRA